MPAAVVVTSVYARFVYVAGDANYARVWAICDATGNGAQMSLALNSTGYYFSDCGAGTFVGGGNTGDVPYLPVAGDLVETITHLTASNVTIEIAINGGPVGNGAAVSITTLASTWGGPLWIDQKGLGGYLAAQIIHAVIAADATSVQPEFGDFRDYLTVRPPRKPEQGAVMRAALW